MEIPDCETCGGEGLFERVTATGTTVEWPCPDCDPDTCAICTRREHDVESIDDRRPAAWNARELAQDEARFGPILGVDHGEARICWGCWIGV